jgi:DNA polymerase III subunit epsilon
MNLLFLDIETTGVDTGKHAVLQIAADYYENDVLTKNFQCRIHNPEAWIDLSALKVNKIHYNTIREPLIEHSTMTEYEAVGKLVDFFMGLNLIEPVVIVGQNVLFDVNFIKELLKKYRIEGFNAVFSNRVLDTASIGLFLQAAGLLKTSLNKIGKGLGLESLAEALNVTIDKSKTHDAQYDVWLTTQVYYKMLDLIKIKEIK